MVMFGTLLGPGSILLMLVGACSVAFGVSNLNALYYNCIPIILFTISCFFLSPKKQILFALLLSILYAIEIIAVICGELKLRFYLHCR